MSLSSDMEFIGLTIFLLSTLGQSPVAKAHTACPQGVTLGSSQCLPTGPGATQALSPSLHGWKTTWDDLASDAEVTVMGTSSDQSSRREAEGRHSEMPIDGWARLQDHTGLRKPMRLDRRAGGQSRELQAYAFPRTYG